MALVLRPLDDAGAPAWDAFVHAHPEGTFFHLAAWRHIIERAFGHRAHYLLAERDGAIAGVLPLAQVKTRLFGNALISVPFCVYGGPLAADAETAVARRTRGCPDAPARCARAGIPLPRPGTLARCRRMAGAIGPLRHLPQALHRRRRSQPQGNPAQAARDGAQGHRPQSSLRHRCNADRLHRIYAESVRNLGTPVFARRYFRLLVELFRDSADIVTVLDGDEPIASVMNFYFRDEVLPYYGGGRAIARDRSGNDFMYWEVMRRAPSAASGCSISAAASSAPARLPSRRTGALPRSPCTIVSGSRPALRSPTSIRSTRNTGCSSPPGNACRCRSPTRSGRTSCGDWVDAAHALHQPPHPLSTGPR